MKYMMNKNRLFILLSLFLGVCVVGCSDSDDSGTYSEDYSDALISSFTLSLNSSICRWTNGISLREVTENETDLCLIKL